MKPNNGYFGNRFYCSLWKSLVEKISYEKEWTYYFKPISHNVVMIMAIFRFCATCITLEFTILMGSAIYVSFETHGFWISVHQYNMDKLLVLCSRTTQKSKPVTANLDFHIILSDNQFLLCILNWAYSTLVHVLPSVKYLNTEAEASI